MESSTYSNQGQKPYDHFNEEKFFHKIQYAFMTKTILKKLEIEE
jgi:hypothetical protein